MKCMASCADANCWCAVFIFAGDGFPNVDYWQVAEISKTPAANPDWYYRRFVQCKLRPAIDLKIKRIRELLNYSGRRIPVLAYQPDLRIGS